MYMLFDLLLLQVLLYFLLLFCYFQPVKSPSWIIAALKGPFMFSSSFCISGLEQTVIVLCLQVLNTVYWQKEFGGCPNVNTVLCR